MEVDEVWIGGKEKNKHFNKKIKNAYGRHGKMPVVGMRNCWSGDVIAQVVSSAEAVELKSFIYRNSKIGTRIYTDKHRSYYGFPNHRTVKHKRKQYVQGGVHTNGIESFWALLRRGYYDTFHYMSFKHLQRYVNEFVFRHNNRPRGTVEQMVRTVAGLDGKRLRYCDLTS